MGHEAVILAPQYPGAHRMDKEAGRTNIYRFKSYSLEVFLKTPDQMVYKKEKRRVYDKLDKIQPDILHCHTEFNLGRMAAKWGVNRGVPVVETAHTFFEQYIKSYFPQIPGRIQKLYTRNFLRRQYNRAQTLVVPTEKMRHVVLQYNITPPVEVIPTGIDDELFTRRSKDQDKTQSPLFENYPQLRGKKICLFVGRLKAEKNVDFLVDTAAELIKDVPNAVFVLVGDGNLKGVLQKLIRSRGLEEHFLFTGRQPRERLPEFYSLADVFTFPSKTETQGLVTIEAMLAGTPAVAIGEMGTADVMGGDNGGFMVEDDVTSFTEKTRLLLTDEALYKKKSKEAVRHANQFTISETVTRLLDVYQNLLPGTPL